MGNDDFLVNLPALETLQHLGLLGLLHNRNVPPTPFSNKDNERIDTPTAPREPQYYADYVSTLRA
ncbi:MAG TPA: hypothetical protein ENJ63_00560 [Dissulfuribacter thermophilus]|uniref:Uncharacterized protein n=1 Tax=Dissulfuribacter thermophilus TaxID=1156395 RepID=A0A7V2SUV6_9BACT|nr:hypothetical protein [Dissulfuribacter thermophilus]